MKKTPQKLKFRLMNLLIVNTERWFNNVHPLRDSSRFLLNAILILNIFVFGQPSNNELLLF